MSEPVSLREVAEELGALTQGWTAYLHRPTGELFSLSEDMGLRAERDEGDDEEQDGSDGLPQWERELLIKSREVLESDDWIELPTQFDIHELRIMETFVDSVEHDDARNQLIRALRGKKAFRHFKDTVKRFGIEQRWYQYRTTAIEEIVAEWLDEHEIAYR